MNDRDIGAVTILGLLYEKSKEKRDECLTNLESPLISRGIKMDLAGNLTGFPIFLNMEYSLSNCPGHINYAITFDAKYDLSCPEVWSAPIVGYLQNDRIMSEAEFLLYQSLRGSISFAQVQIIDETDAVELIRDSVLPDVCIMNHQLTEEDKLSYRLVFMAPLIYTNTYLDQKKYFAFNMVEKAFLHRELCFVRLLQLLQKTTHPR